MFSNIILQGDIMASLGSLPYMLVVLAIFYFFFIAPQKKQQKKQQEFLASMKKGMEVVTSSGIIGKVNKVEDKEVQLQVSEKTFIRFTKGAVSREMTEALHAKEETK